MQECHVFQLCARYWRINNDWYSAHSGCWRENTENQVGLNLVGIPAVIYVHLHNQKEIEILYLKFFKINAIL